MSSVALSGLNKFVETILVFLGAWTPESLDLYATGRPTFSLIEETSGTVRYKRSHSATWHAAKAGTPLFTGDRVFVDESGSILLRFPTLKATVFCSTPSMFPITEDIEMIRHRDRWFVTYAVLDPNKAAMDEETEKLATDALKKERNYFIETIEKPGDREKLSLKGAPFLLAGADKKLEQLSFEMTDNVSAGSSRFLRFDNGVFSYVRQVNLLKWKQPRGKLELVTKKFPAKIDVEVENNIYNTPLYAYLWKDKALTPKWSGVSRGHFKNILIPQPGQYKIQVFAEDNSSASDFLEINASSRNNNTLIPKEWSDGQTRWLDD